MLSEQANLNLNVMRQPVRQQGAALATALIMLLVLTVVGVSALNTITTEETMAGNMRDQIIALQATETAIRDSEALLNSEVSGFPWFYVNKKSPTCVGGSGPTVCDGSEGGSVLTANGIGSLVENFHNDAYWEATNGAFPYAGSAIYGVSDNPSYFIEKSGKSEIDSLSTGTDSASQDGAKQYYTTTARGKGGNPNTVSVVRITTAVRAIP